MYQGKKDAISKLFLKIKASQAEFRNKAFSKEGNNTL